jgi:LPXTG-motif cell wall-anchored protein
MASRFVQQIDAARRLTFLRDTTRIAEFEREKSMVSKSSVLVFAVFLMLMILPVAMMADEWNKATQLTFNEPIEVPGMVLAPGTYWFTLADSDSDRNIVEVWNSDRTHLVTTILAVPDYRLQPTGKTVVHFEERPSDAPEAIHSWFYPGDNYGEEFVYPKSRATQLAKQTNRPVLSMPEPRPSGVQQIKQAPVKAVTPSGEEIEISEVIVSQPTTANEAPPSSLPKTGSNLPLLGLVGLLALGTSVGLRIVARRIS